jgi:hypothetical protein
MEEAISQYFEQLATPIAPLRPNLSLFNSNPSDRTGRSSRRVKVNPTWQISDLQQLQYASSNDICKLAAIGYIVAAGQTLRFHLSE